MADDDVPRSTGRLSGLKRRIFGQSKLQRVRQENVEMSNELERLREENDELRQANVEMSNELERLREENGELRQANVEMSNELERLREENNELGSQIQQLLDDEERRMIELERCQQDLANKDNEIARLRDGGMSSFLVERESVALREEIGNGAWGLIYKGIHHGTEVAVKEFHRLIISPHNLKKLQREIDIASQCRHPNLLQFICATTNEENHLLIVTELMDQSLRSFLERRAVKSPLPPQGLDYQEIKLISSGVALGLSYLHSKELIHRDISSANVLLTMENGKVRRAKISDYGSVNFMELCSTPNPGAIIYAAPEAKQSTKMDVFSFGILLCEMAICELPDPDKREKQFERIPNEKVKRLVKTCTKHEPDERPTMEEVIGLWERFFAENAWHSSPARMSRENLNKLTEKSP